MLSEQLNKPPSIAWRARWLGAAEVAMRTTSPRERAKVAYVARPAMCLRLLPIEQESCRLARAFCEAMSRMGCREVTVAVRRIEAGERFAGEMAMTFPGIRFRAAAFDDLDGSAADLVFNATPLGSRDQPLPEALKRVIYGQMVVFDAVYRPMRTELLEVAEERGCRTIPGYEMLLNQGTAGFEIWTGRPAPREAMGEALRRSLGAES